MEICNYKEKSLFVDDNIAYLKYPRKSTENFRIKKFSLMAKQKTALKNKKAFQ